MRRPRARDAAQGAARAPGDLLGARTDRYWQTPTVLAAGIVQVPFMLTLPTMPVQQGVPPVMQGSPLGRQQLPRMAPVLSFAKFVQQAPSSDRQ